LRERRDDVPLLVDHFLHKHRYTAGSDPARISQGALQQLMDYDWPGNVRELENVIERAVILAQGTVITERHIDFTGASMRQVINVPQSLREGKSLDDLIQTVERQAIAEALTQSDGNQVAAAAMLGIGEPDLAKRIKRFGL
jgi:two-component system, NtrC family, response regulator AtoC